MLIAKRELEYVTETGTALPVPVLLYAPENNGKDWGCRCTIGWPSGVEARSGSA